MADNYEKYVAAEQAAKEASNRVSDVQGGSTQQAMSEALANNEQAQQASAEAWQKFLDDPTG